MAHRLAITISNDDLEVRLGNTLILRHSPKSPALDIGYGEARISCSHGNYRIRPGLKWRRPLHRITVLESSDAILRLLFSGAGTEAVEFVVTPQDGCDGLCRATIHRAGSHGDAARADNSGGSGAAAPPPGAFNRVWLRLPAAHGEATFGGGQQFSRFNLRGSRLPLWCGEQGVGRGFNLTTLAANLHSKSGGHWHSTYFPQPTYVTEHGRIVHSESDAYALFSFERTREVLEIWQPEFDVMLGAADGSLSRAVQILSGYLGRQPRLPEWTHGGMWLGLQGGSGIVRSKVERAKEAGIPLSGVWVQDWSGRRVTSFGNQLFWDWRYDRKLYPDLPDLTAELRSDGVRFLGYMNPFIAIEGELYKEARDQGYCVKAADGSDYMIVVTTFPAATIDLTNPDAFDWYKKVIRENMIGVGLSGWMADYGEYLPTDAVLANGDPRLFHNRYPAEWARLNYEAISEAGKLDDVAIFMRAGYTGSSRYAHSVWAGDQMVDWSRNDGLPSVLPSALSSAVAGIGVHHSDLGGFTSLFGSRRSKELFMRWADFCAFTPVMRSHESNRPKDNWQWDSDAQTTAHLARAAGIYVALAPYRRAVLEEYYGSGLPAMRPVGLHYPPGGESGSLSARNSAASGFSRRPVSYLFGRDLLVQPVVSRGATMATVHLPEDDWIHLWTGVRVSGGVATVQAPAGRIPAFYRPDSTHAGLFASIAGL